MTKKLNHKILLYRLQTKHDQEAFALLYDHYVKQIYRFVFFKVSNHEEAEDITAEVFLKIWHYINGGHKIESFSGLLYKMARNSVIDLYRSKAKQPELLLDQNNQMDLSDRGGERQELADRVEVQQIIIFLRRLKQEYQEVLTLRFIDDLPINEIAQVTGKSRVAVRVTLHRALKKLKEIMTANTL